MELLRLKSIDCNVRLDTKQRFVGVVAAQIEISLFVVDFSERDPTQMERQEREQFCSGLESLRLTCSRST
jgi:hypothetical protein